MSILIWHKSSTARFANLNEPLKVCQATPPTTDMNSTLSNCRCYLIKSLQKCSKAKFIKYSVFRARSNLKRAEYRAVIGIKKKSESLINKDYVSIVAIYTCTHNKWQYIQQAYVPEEDTSENHILMVASIRVCSIDRYINADTQKWDL